MTPLRQKMIDAMIVRGFAARTQNSYLYAVTHLANHYHQSPDKLDENQIRAFFLYLAKDKKLSSSRTCYACGLRVNELVNLQVRHLDYDRQLIRIEQGKGAKE